MTYECSGCGMRSCDGRCFSECEADYPDEVETIEAGTAEIRATTARIAVKIAASRVEQDMAA